MTTEKDKEVRKISRDFKGKVKLMEKTPLRDLDKMFSEYYDEGIERYIRDEKLKHPNMTEKEILIEMYKFSEKLKGRKYKK